ncbi:hypothetical protein [Histidinibacterium lentulum]|uniref:EF-hand domain-containing protein n=1 Tax=Histidinibacterium lentulum TaxID=2480588 RepID=A0A3N2R4W3_9RHOB|nr:hypothetical protein [Histidinibacterium lentulum]ROU02433.1 hypothetical protein EAT49_08810 [Histidinibacterium lentulum]
MTYDLAKLAGTTALLAALAAAPAHAQGMSDMDTDQDSAVSQEEFTTGYGTGGGMSDWDQDMSGTVSEEEFTSGMSRASSATANPAWSDQDFATADTDQSGDLSLDELAAVIFLIYDADQSGDLTADEFASYEADRQMMDDAAMSGDGSDTGMTGDGMSGDDTSGDGMSDDDSSEDDES